MAAPVELAPPPAPSIASKHGAHGLQNCPACGTTIEPTQEAEAARRKMVELEAQMELLKEKATAAVDKCADYEDQIRSLRIAQGRNGLARSNTDTVDTSRSSHEDPRPATSGGPAARPSPFSFLTGRRTSPNNSTSQPPPSTSTAATPVDLELLNELDRERTLRAKAEERAEKVDMEIEELSVQLFSQANEMVATERKARAKLEERIEMLERKDKDKMARLDRLESAVSRLDRVKAMLNQPQTNGQALGGAMLAPPGKR